MFKHVPTYLRKCFSLNFFSETIPKSNMRSKISPEGISNLKFETAYKSSPSLEYYTKSWLPFPHRGS